MIALDPERAAFLGEVVEPRISTEEVARWLRERRRNGWPFYVLSALGVDPVQAFVDGSRGVIVKAAEELARRSWFAAWVDAEASGVLHVLPPAEEGEPFRLEWRP